MDDKARKTAYGDRSWLARLEERISLWLKRRAEERMLRRFGGIQWCPWCKQVAQWTGEWHFYSRTDPYIVALHCGNCGGVSRWRFEMGMIPLSPIGLTPPPVECAAAIRSTGATNAD